MIKLSILKHFKEKIIIQIITIINIMMKLYLNNLFKLNNLRYHYKHTIKKYKNYNLIRIMLDNNLSKRQINKQILIIIKLKYHS